jgi:ferredoxin
VAAVEVRSTTESSDTLTGIDSLALVVSISKNSQKKNRVGSKTDQLMASSSRFVFVAFAALASFRPFVASMPSQQTSLASNAIPDDTFTFRQTILSVDASKGNAYGPKDWGLVHCNDIGTCVSVCSFSQIQLSNNSLLTRHFLSQPGYPTNWKAMDPVIPYNTSMNMCISCSHGLSSGKCATNKQSPIPLLKNVTATSQCVDRHLMKYHTGNCPIEKLDL